MWFRRIKFALILLGFFLIGFITRAVGLYSIYQEYMAKRAKTIEKYKIPEENASIKLDSLRFIDLENHQIVIDPGKPLFINIWATWCIPCVAELPYIDSLSQSVGDQVSFFIASYEEIDKIKAFKEKRKDLEMNFVKIDKKLPRILQGYSIPRTYILHQEKIILSDKGAHDWNTSEAKAFLERLANCQ